MRNARNASRMNSSIKEERGLSPVLFVEEAQRRRLRVARDRDNRDLPPRWTVMPRDAVGGGRVLLRIRLKYPHLSARQGLELMALEARMPRIAFEPRQGLPDGFSISSRGPDRARVGVDAQRRQPRTRAKTEPFRRRAICRTSRKIPSRRSGLPSNRPARVARAREPWDSRTAIARQPESLRMAPERSSRPCPCGPDSC